MKKQVAGFILLTIGISLAVIPLNFYAGSLQSMESSYYDSPPPEEEIFPPEEDLTPPEEETPPPEEETPPPEEETPPPEKEDPTPGKEDPPPEKETPPPEEETPPPEEETPPPEEETPPPEKEDPTPGKEDPPPGKEDPPEDKKIVATVTVKPETLNCESKGKWIIVFIELPEGHSVDDINLSSIRLNGVVSPETHPCRNGNHNHHHYYHCHHNHHHYFNCHHNHHHYFNCHHNHHHNKHCQNNHFYNQEDGVEEEFNNVLMVKFSREEVREILEEGESVMITITGTLINGQEFEGNDYIKVIS